MFLFSIPKQLTHIYKTFNNNYVKAIKNFPYKLLQK